MKDKGRRFPNIWQLLLSLPLIGLLLTSGFLIVLGNPNPSIDELNSRNLFLSYASGFGAVLLVLYLLSGRRTIRWKGWSGIGLGAIALLSLLFIPIRLPIVQLMPVSDALLEQFENLIIFDIWGFLTICVAAALLEELIFRGIILEGLLRNYDTWLAIIISSVVFGIAHLNPVQFVSAALLGLFIGWLYSRTRSVIPGILVHFINNSVPFIVGLYADKHDTMLGDNMEAPFLQTALAAIVCLLVSIPLIRRIDRLLPPETDFQNQVAVEQLDSTNNFSEDLK